MSRIGASSLREDRACGPSDLSRCASQPEALVPLRVLSLFAGIGGFDLGLERTGGFKTVAFCEIDPFCRRVLAKHWPEVPCYHDVRELTGAQVGRVDVICGGFPCQDISEAGQRAGLSGERSGLWRDFARLIRELRPRFVIVENVSELLVQWAGDVLGDLAALGYDAVWNAIPASHIGARHIRDRVWIAAFLPNAASARIEQFWRQQLAQAGNCRRSLHLRFNEPEPPRVAAGIPYRSHRNRALGNAVVPQIPELIGRAILAAIADTHPKGGDVKQAPSLMSGGGAGTAIAQPQTPISGTS